MTEPETDRALDLLALAKAQTQKSRHLLLENMTDLFLSPEGRLNEQDRSIMLDILGKLIDEVEIEVRRSLAERLAVLPDAPHELVVKLSEDNHHVARPLLLKSPVLRDADLVEIVRHRSLEHRMAIAMRSGIGTEVVEALLEHGEHDVIEALIRNQDAALSRQAIDYLVEESRRIDRFQEPLLHRQDLPPQVAFRMFWWVSAALRRHILAEFKVDAGDLDDAIESAVHAALAKNASGEPEAVKLAARMFERGELTERNVLQTLRMGHVSAFVAGLGRLGGIDFPTARRLVFAPGGEALAAVCRAAEFTRQGFATAFMLVRSSRDPGATTPPSDVDAIMGLYDRINRNQARIALRYWMRDIEFIDAIAAIGGERVPLEA